MTFQLAGHWTPERVERLKELWAKGHSCSQIARILGGGISRNAVIGKVSRLGLVMCGNGNPRPKIKGPRLGRKVMPPVALAPVPEPSAITDENGARFTVMTIRNGLCRWPFGDPAQADFHFCGNNCERASVYCDFHDRKAFQPSTRRAPNARAADELSEIARRERALA